jgi:hypothetical protein
VLRRLTAYDVECGIAIDAACAAFEGVDPDPDRARVFAAIAHRRTRGKPDGTNNPLGVEGAGWVGFIGLRTGPTETTIFRDVADGCRAAAVLMHSPGFAAVWSAFRARDVVRLAREIEMSPLRSRVDVRELAAEVEALRGRWWSVLADQFTFRRALIDPTGLANEARSAPEPGGYSQQRRHRRSRSSARGHPRGPSSWEPQR